MTKEIIREKASEFISTRASGMPKEMDYYADILTEFATEVTKELQEENAELKKVISELKEFYEKEYFEIADRTADEKIKELEKYQTEVTVDDYNQYDPNTWGMMHEEMFVPKELVRDLLKENYALITKAKELLKGIVDTPMYYQMGGEMYESEEYKELIAEAEQFLNSEVEK